MIHRSQHSKYYNNIGQKLSLISLKCCSKAHVTYESRKFPCLHLNRRTIRSILTSEVTAKICYMFYGSDPSVWAQGTKTKRKVKFTKHFLLMVCYFHNILGHFCLLTHPFQTGEDKDLAVVQMNQWNYSMDAKEILTIKQHSQKPEICQLETKRNASCLAAKETRNMFMTQLRLQACWRWCFLSFGSRPTILISDALCSSQFEQCWFCVLSDARSWLSLFYFFCIVSHSTSLPKSLIILQLGYNL